MGRTVRRSTALALLVGLTSLGFGAAVPAQASEELEFTYDGFFKLDLAYDSALSSHGNFIMYVKPHVAGDATATTNLTARQTRVGLNFNRERMKGRVEFDFYGGGAENRNLILLRKAYVDVDLGKAILRAGQASDVISPLVPSTINYTVTWGVGNIGYRRPLVQLSATTSSGFSGAVALARNISEDLNGDSVLDGDASCMPVVQSRLGYTMGGDRNVTVGVSGHYGVMDSEGEVDDQYHTWSANLDVKAKLSDRVTVSGEAYRGANTGAYFGAILNGDCMSGLDSRGGWASVSVKASDRFTVGAGYGIDDLIDEETSYIATMANARTQNETVFGHVVYTIAPGIRTGVELSYWQTSYANVSDGFDPDPAAVRVQWTIQSSF